MWWASHVKVAYEPLAEPDMTLARLSEMSPRTIVFDVEPLVAMWDTDQAALVRGVTAILEHVNIEAAGVQVVVFATNSRRRLPTQPSGSAPRVIYLPTAAKPLRTRAYRNLPRPGVVVGDQIATDGVLAWRLGYSFLHYRPHVAQTPLGTRVMNHLGRPLRPMLFVRTRRA